jgi:xanthine dehydrogenase accessory factor
MYDIAAQVRDWMAAGQDVRVAQVVESRGLSSREPVASAAWTADGVPVGRLLAGIDVAALDSTQPGLVEISISDDDAVAAGLACGGQASVLVQPAAAYPAEMWSRLADREPLCLVTELDETGHASATQMFTPQTIRDAARSGSYGDPVPRLFGRGTTGAAVVETDGPRLAVVALWPVPTMVVVGDGLIAKALSGAADLLGWPSRVTPQAEPAIAAVRELHRSDVVVVLSHDRAVDGPVLAAALASPVGYIGGLGSRHTQEARREWLTAHGVAVQNQARVHGPAGLDLDAHTPAEIAISIVAEILANRAGTSGGSLRERPGPVHAAGVNAPPPRY